ncbi:hypothetical protein [Allosphingosinicella sp.]|uniref:hypothetical protein n=1 Tax=Allosphingosinicella sp. TaxID=2823234 RepID=UPI002EF42A41
MTTSPSRIAWPGRRVTSREIPLRLLRRPRIATRSTIGVVPGAVRVTVCGISTVSGCGSDSFAFDSRSGAPRGPQAEAASRAAAATRSERRSIAQSGVQAS